jgi:hypothetical protein
MHRRFWLGIGVIVLLPGLTWAARPLDTEDPGTVPQGQGEFQGSVDAAKGDDGALVGLKGSLGFGLLSNMDIRFQTALLWVDPLDAPSRVGMADSLVGFKHRLLDETETLPAFLYAITLRFPTSLGASGLAACRRELFDRRLRRIVHLAHEQKIQNRRLRSNPQFHRDVARLSTA